MRTAADEEPDDSAGFVSGSASGTVVYASAGAVGALATNASDIVHILEALLN